MIPSVVYILHDVMPYPAPVPPPKPPKSHHLVQDVEKSEMDRDSGMWTGSLSEDVAEWTKHRTTSKAGSSSLLL